MVPEEDPKILCTRLKYMNFPSSVIVRYPSDTPEFF